MATHLDLQEQEQLDELKHFWKQYGNLITWTLIIALGAYAAWNGWTFWQRQQAIQAAGMYDELEKAAQGGDAQRAATIFGDLKERYPRTLFAEQGGLLAAKLQVEKQQSDAAAATLAWVADNGAHAEYQTIARLRAAGLLIEQKKYDEALKRIEGEQAPEFAGLIGDRRGDILLAQGKAEEAKKSYQLAYKSMDAKVEYRRIIEAKLIALGVAPEPAPTDAAEASK